MLAPRVLLGLKASPAPPNSGKEKPGAVSRPGTFPEFLFPDIALSDSCQD
jgi:hypothetical protein